VKHYNEIAKKFPKETGGSSREITLEKWPIEKLNYLKEYIIEYAMEKKKKIEFTHNGRIIKCEPQVLGVLKGKTQLLESQTEGESSSWKRFNFDEIDITKLKTTQEGFDKPKTYPSVEENLWDRKLNEAKYEGGIISISQLIEEEEKRMLGIGK
jgi:hypothetical protein